MKLELKHLAPYFTHKLMYLYDDEILEMDGLDVNGDVFNCDMGETPIEYIKPILRPLEDLTKQNVLDMIEYSDFEYIYHNINPIDLIFINTEEKNYLSDILNQTEFLFKNHFDVFGLIEKGLAIDINTIK